MIKKDIGIIGSGVVGSTTAFHLARMGHNVTIIDPKINEPSERNNYLTGSKASLGVLMGNTFTRSSGRSWVLRQRSMSLWSEWVKELSSPEILLEIKAPVIKLAKDRKEMESMQRMSHERIHLGLEILRKQDSTKGLAWPKHHYGGLISHQDGWINPLKLLSLLMKKLDTLKVEKVNDQVLYINRISTFKKTEWKIFLENNPSIKKDYIIICAALDSQLLLEQIGYKIPLMAVLGQALELIIEKDNKNWQGWPAVLNSNGVNLIPQSANEIIIGATLEHGEKPNKDEIKNLQNLKGNSPDWLKNASIKNHWWGIRAKPSNKAAPLLEEIEQGLIINTAHYRNGILLAPACAEWIGNQI